MTTSQAAQGDAALCQWCGRAIPASAHRWCSKLCRQTAWRARRLRVVEGLGDEPKRLAYADPPYPGLARRYYSDQPTFAGEVDHRHLLDVLRSYDGWALSTSQEALSDVLSLIPRGVGDVEVCPWVKTHGAPRARGPANIHEYLIVSPARRRFPGVPDALVAAVARGGDSDLIGRKPLRFVAWMCSLLGALPGDSMADLFPGSGVVDRYWSEFQRTRGES